MRNKLFLSFLLFFISFPVYSKNTNLVLGTSINILNIDDPDYYFNNNEYFKSPSINVGLSYKTDQKFPIVISVFTNRLFLWSRNQEIISKKSGDVYLNKNKIIIDTFLLGYQIKQFIPSIFISNVNFEKKLYLKNALAGQSNQSSLLYGVVGNYFYNKNLSFTFGLIAPKKEFNLKKGFSLGFNYNFNL